MLNPAALDKEDILAIDRGYIDYERFEELTKKGVVYGTKMKKNLRYTILSDTRPRKDLWRSAYNM